MKLVSSPITSFWELSSSRSSSRCFGNRRCCARRWRRSAAPCCAASRCRPGAPAPSAAAADVSVAPPSEGATQMGRSETVYHVVC